MLVPDVAADRHSCQSEPENRHHPTQLATTGLGTGPEEICSAIPGPWSQVPPFSAYRNTSRYLIVRAEPLVHFDYRAAFLQPRHRVINDIAGNPVTRASCSTVGVRRRRSSCSTAACTRSSTAVYGTIISRNATGQTSIPPGRDDLRRRGTFEHS